MDKLKQALYEETFYQKKRYLLAVKDFGESAPFTLDRKRLFTKLYDIIIIGDCESEFIKWSKQRRRLKLL